MKKAIKPKAPMRPEAASVWMIAVCWRGHNPDKRTALATWHGNHATRSEAIKAYEQRFNDSWKQCYRRGDRAIRVLITTA